MFVQSAVITMVLLSNARLQLLQSKTATSNKVIFFGYLNLTVAAYKCILEESLSA